MLVICFEVWLQLSLFSFDWKFSNREKALTIHQQNEQTNFECRTSTFVAILARNNKGSLQAINFNDLFFSEKRLYTLCSLQIQTFYWEKVNSTLPRKYLFNELDNMKTNKAELPKFTVNEKRWKKFNNSWYFLFGLHIFICLIFIS